MSRSIRRSLGRWFGRDLEASVRRSPRPSWGLEPLEPRCLMTTFVVDVISDDDNGNTDPGDLSLREAVRLADETVGEDTITFASSLNNSTITLSGTPLTLNDEDRTTIQGPGQDLLTIDADGSSRVFQIGEFGPSAIDSVATISGLTIQGGSSSSSGGGISIAGTLTLDDARVTGNTASSGGGIGVLFNGRLELNSSTIANNLATSNGGGIQVANGNTVEVSNSTIAGNTALDNGGGLSMALGSMSLTNSTISGNSAQDRGGGVYFNDATTARMTNTTVAFNQADSDGNGTGAGGGVWARPLASWFLFNSIVTGNTEGAQGTADNVANNAPLASSQGNLVGSGGVTLSDANNNVLGVDDGVLEPLADNGGTTSTHALLVGSPAINGGRNNLAVDSDGNPLTNDQRGTGFDRILNGIVDIGAFESPLEGPSLVVDTVDDVVSGTDLQTSLREAIVFAELLPGENAVTFDLPDDSTITLSGSPIELTDSDRITIAGSGQDNLTLDANGQSQGITVAQNALVTISDLTITGGTGGTTNSDSFGAGIDNLGDLTIARSVITGNTTAEFGGGISNQGTLSLLYSQIRGNESTLAGGGLINLGVAEIVGSTISGNTTTTRRGGGIYNLNSLNVLNSTITSNTAEISGGGIHSQRTSSSMNLINSTVSGNVSKQDGGGIGVDLGSLVTLTHSTIAFNVADSDGDGSGSGGGVSITRDGSLTLFNSIVSTNTQGAGGTADNLAGLAPQSESEGNLIGSANSTDGVTLDSSTNLVDEDDPLLGPLQDNEGPTFTHAITLASPALNAGVNARALDPSGNELVTDQRSGGFLRRGGATVDAGAFEVQAEPARFLVDTFDFQTSLREAVLLANATAGSNTITFHSDLANGTIALNGDQLELTDSDETIIDGIDATTLTVDANQLSRVLSVDSGAVATIRNLTLTGGSVAADNGGAMENRGTLTIEQSSLTNSTSGLNGGAIANVGGTLILNDSTIESNIASFNGGGLWSSGGVVELTDSFVTGNTAGMSIGAFGVGLGGGINSSNTTMTLTNTVVQQNSAGLVGGGLRTLGGSVAFESATIQDNTSQFGEGGLSSSQGTVDLNETTVSGNVAVNGRAGGIFAGDNITFTVSNSTIEDNTASGGGGGIYYGGGSTSTAVITSSTIRGNQSSFGGGITSLSSGFVIRDTTINNNVSAKLGGGLANSGSVDIINSTISGNTANAEGGGIASFSGQLGIVNSTIVRNRADLSDSGYVGGGIFTSSVTVTLANSIVSENMGTGGANDNLAGVVPKDDSQGNLIGTGPVTLTDADNNLLGINDPGLGDLADNGGPTFTHAILETSPAFDAGIDDLARIGFFVPLLFDQRGPGFQRIGGDTVDIGAFEFLEEPSLVVTTLDDVVDSGDNETSLREAINYAVALEGDEDIIFEDGLEGSILLDQEISINNNEFFDFDNRVFTILGDDRITLDGQGITRHFHIDGGGFYETSVTLKDLTLTNGYARFTGGSLNIIAQGAQVLLDNVTITGNRSGGPGGAISADATLTIVNSIISGNTSEGQGGALFNYGDYLKVENTQIVENTSMRSGGGIFTRDGESQVVLVDVEVRSNSSSINGGGIRSIGFLTMTGSVSAETRPTSVEASIWSEEQPKFPTWRSAATPPYTTVEAFLLRAVRVTIPTTCLNSSI